MVAHELTHAVWWLSGEVEATKDQEFHAYVAQLFTLMEFGGQDLLQQHGWFALDENGDFSETKLWEYIYLSEVCRPA